MHRDSRRRLHMRVPVRLLTNARSLHARSIRSVARAATLVRRNAIADSITHGITHSRTDGSTDGSTDCRTDGRAHRGTDGDTDSSTNNPSLRCRHALLLAEHDLR